MCPLKILLVLLTLSLGAVANKKTQNHGICKRAHHQPATKMLPLLSDQPCMGVPGHTTNPMRLPHVIPHISCPIELDHRCIQLMLPMEVMIKNPRLGNFEKKTISVPSGCMEKTTAVTGAKSKSKGNKKSTAPKNANKKISHHDG